MKTQQAGAGSGAAASLVAARTEQDWSDLAPARVAAADSENALLELLSNTLRGLCPNLLRCEVYLTDERGALAPAARCGDGHCGGGPALLGLLRSRLPVTERLRGVARAHLCRGPGAAAGSLMGALLLDAREVIGGIVVEATTPSGFTTSDQTVLEGIAALFSMSLQRLRSGAHDRLHAWAALDREWARGVQRRLMDAHLPGDAGVKVDARYLPALDVGGDFYELVPLGDGTIGGAIGDVSGKGVSAALIMSRVSWDLRRALRSGISPSAVLRSVNAELTGLDSETFVTASCIRLDPERGRLTVANAGHVPLLVRRASGEVFTFGSPSGTPLGIMQASYSDEEIALEPLDIVLLMTDGVLDALDWPSDPLGMERVLGAVASAPHDPKTMNALLLETVSRARGTRLPDDMTLVALQLVP